VRGAGPGNSITGQSVTEEFLDKAERRVQASNGRPIVWIVAEPEVATYLQELFADSENQGVKKIIVINMRWMKRTP
jgi:hypothetical protein